MATNLVVINRSKGLTWLVADSKMKELMEFLHTVGAHQQPTLKDEGTEGDASEDEPSSDSEGHWSPVFEIDPSGGVKEAT